LGLLKTPRSARLHKPQRQSKGISKASSKEHAPEPVHITGDWNFLFQSAGAMSVTVHAPPAKALKSSAKK
jgi:hypothetical protein